MKKEDIYKIVLEIIGEYFIRELGESYDSSKSLKDNNMDSIQLIKLIVEIEDYFGIEFPDEVYFDTQNLDCKYFSNCIKQYFDDNGM